MNEYVIIGNGVAAAGCIEGIRSADKDGKITVVSQENHPVYCRPLISYYLEGKTTKEKMNYRKDGFYEENGCEVIYGKKATEINTEKKQVILDDGSVLPYLSVCVATGSSPFVPKFEGIDSVEKKLSFMTMDDMLELEKAIDENSRVLIVGAGLIGLKCAEGIKERVKSITVCDLADRVLSSILDAQCAKTVQEHLEKNGIEFMLSDSVEVFDKNSAKMKSGKTVEFDILVLAVGVRANTSLVKDIGGEVDRGIIVDEKMKTSVENIYAAGDCTQGTDVSSNTKKVIALVPNAYMQGKCAGMNMAGSENVFNKAIPMNAIGFFGLHMLTAGTYYDETQGGEVYTESGEGCFKKLFTKDGFLTGFIMIGETDRAGIYTSLIRNRVPLDSVDFEMLKKSPTTFAFSEGERKRMFGSVVCIMVIDVNGLDYKALNEKIRECDGDVTLTGCCGQRFIASGLGKKNITINGVPGNALGAYLNGAMITVKANAQDAVGDTMNDGKIIVHGNIGDAAGYAMRGGEMYIKGNAGYRAGIHMKEYKEKCPILVIGGNCGSFLGEYQAGGVIIALGLSDNGKSIVGNFPCTGMHGGKMFLRSDCRDIIFPKNVTAEKATAEDMEEIDSYITEFCSCFGYDKAEVLNAEFTKIVPDSKNPYKQMYVAN